MIKLIDVLKEAKQVGLLYHFTNEEGIISILTTNSLVASKKYTNHISTTRDKNGWMVGAVPDRLFRITLDGNKLSDKYNIKPFNIGLNRGVGHTESEEAIMTNIIPNIRDYILEIAVDKDIMDPEAYYGYDLNKVKKLYPNIKVIKRNRSSEWGDALPPDSPEWDQIN